MQFQQKITPFLSFESQAGEAAEFYVSVLPDSKILRTVKNPQNDAVMTVEFQLAGMTFVALNVGMPWQFTEAFSLAVACETQDEIDELWSKLTADGKEIQCGWLVDKFGVSWQIVPNNIGSLVGGPDAEAAQRAMAAMMGMIKLDKNALEAAYAGDAS